MRRARLWAAGKLLALARRVAGGPDPEPIQAEEDDLPFAAVTLTDVARRMLADGELWTRETIARQIAAKKQHEEKPRPGSLHARLEDARNRRET